MQTLFVFEKSSQDQLTQDLPFLTNALYNTLAMFHRQVSLYNLVPRPNFSPIVCVSVRYMCVILVLHVSGLISDCYISTVAKHAQ